jgi:hypothetical protein
MLYLIGLIADRGLLTIPMGLRRSISARGSEGLE